MTVTRLFDFIRFQEEHYPQACAFAGRINGDWRRYSVEEVIRVSTEISKGLIALGVAPGDRIAIVSENRPEWSLVDIGILQTGAISVPIFSGSTQSEISYIIRHAGVRFAFVSSDALYRIMQQIQSEDGRVQAIFSFAELPDCEHLTSVIEAGEQLEDGSVVARMETILPADLATIIYTSGTTGVPKGVMLSHENIVSNVKSTGTVLPLNHTHRTLTVLPLSHAFERMVLYTYMYLGASIYFSRHPDHLSEDMLEVNPHFMTCVPRFLEKIYEQLVGQAEHLGENEKGYVLMGAQACGEA